MNHLAGSEFPQVEVPTNELDQDALKKALQGRPQVSAPLSDELRIDHGTRDQHGPLGWEHLVDREETDGNAAQPEVDPTPTGGREALIAWIVDAIASHPGVNANDVWETLEKSIIDKAELLDVPTEELFGVPTEELYGCLRAAFDQFVNEHGQYSKEQETKKNNPRRPWAFLTPWRYR